MAKNPNVLQVVDRSTTKTLRNRKRRQRKKAIAKVLKRSVVGTANLDGPGTGNIRLRKLRSAARQQFLNKHGIENMTRDGEAWLERALNPCDTSGRGSGFPDMSAAPVVTPHEREKFDIRADLTPIGTVENPGFIGVYKESDLWNLLAVSDPSTLCTYFLIYQGSLGTPSYAAWFTNQDRIRPHLANAGFAESRITAYGTTFEMTGSMVSNQGEMVAAQIAADWTFERMQNANQTNLYEWNLNGDPGVAPSGSQLYEFVRQLMDTDPLSSAGMARTGAYFVHKLNEPSNLFGRHAGQVGGKQRKFYENPFASAFDPIANTDDPTDVRLTLAVHETLMSWNAGVFWATGISTQTSFAVKKYVDIEGHITPKSELRYYTRDAPDEDERALTMYKETIKQMSSAYPSSYNMFGFLKKAFNWGKNAVKWVGNKIVKPFRPILDKVPIASNILQGTDMLGLT